MKAIQHLWPIWVFVLLFVSFSSNCAEPPKAEPHVEPSFVEQKIEPLSDFDDASTVDESKTETKPEPASEPQVEPVPDLVSEPRVEPKTEFVVPDLADSLVPEPIKEVLKELMPESQIPRPGFGTIRGECGVLDDEWKSTKPFYFQNTIDLGTTGFDQKKLTQGGQKIWSDGNLGGSSVHSEIFSYELLDRCELATLIKSEAKIKYKSARGKKTDILVSIDGFKIGVSVTRAYQYTAPGQTQKPYLLSSATKLLTKKLSDIPLSAANAETSDAWSRSILHILALNKQHADIVKKAYQQLSAKLRGNIIIFVTITDGKDDYIY